MVPTAMMQLLLLSPDLTPKSTTEFVSGSGSLSELGSDPGSHRPRGPVNDPSIWVRKSSTGRHQPSNRDLIGACLLRLVAVLSGLPGW